MFILNKLRTSKLLKLKKWFTLPEAAKHLTNICGEDVKEADILRLALDGHISLSVHFLNGAIGHPCKTVHRENYFNEKKEFYLTNPSLSEQLNFHSMNPGISIGGGNFLITEKECTEIRGIWDLPLISGDRVSVETKYQELIDGAENETMALDGTFVEANGAIYQLLESFDNDKYPHHTLMKTQIGRLKMFERSYIIFGKKEILLNSCKNKIKKLEKEYDEWCRYGKYYPSCELPKDCDWVVRAEALREFVDSITEPLLEPLHNKADRPLTTRQRKTCLTIIAALCPSAKIDPQARGASQRIKELTESLGVPVDDETIRTLLSEIPDALEARMK